MSKPEKSPAFQFYPKDWLTDEKVVAMTPSERGQYLTFLCLDWLNNGLNLELHPDLNGGSSLVRSCFNQHPTKAGHVTNPRLLKEREKQAAWREKSSRAGKVSGKIRKIKALQKEPNANQSSTKREPKPNSSSSSSSTSSDQYISLYTDGKNLHPPYVWLSDIEYEAHIMNKGAQFVGRAIEKLNGWIGKDPNDPERRKSGENASATFASWIFKAIAEEQSRATKAAPKTKLTGQEKFEARMQEIAKL